MADDLGPILFIKEELEIVVVPVKLRYTVPLSHESEHTFSENVIPLHKVDSSSILLAYNPLEVQDSHVLLFIVIFVKDMSPLT